LLVVVIIKICDHDDDAVYYGCVASKAVTVLVY